MKIEACIKDWLVECEIRKYTKKTIKGYKTNLNIFQRYCDEEMQITDLDDVDMTVIKKFTQKMIQKGYKGTYINGLLKSIKSFIQYCYEEDLGGFDTKRRGFKWVREEVPVIKPFTPKDVRQILKNCAGNDYLSIRDTAIITTFIETGIRCAELYSIQPKDVKEDYIIIKGKNHKERLVGITPVLKKALMRYDRVRDNYFSYKSPEDYYFLSYSGRQLTNSGIEHMVKRRADGVNPENVRISPHTFRHFFAVQSLKQGRDLYSISTQLGHENLQITSIYLKTLAQEDVIKIAKNSSVLMNI
jgi:integrase/recombinase XerD